MKTLQARAMPGPGDTVGVGDDTIERAMAVAPFFKETIGTGKVPFPRMELSHDVSFCAEMTVRPEDAEEMRRRYRVVSTASQAALRVHWEERLGANPAEKAQFDALLVQYIDYVRTRPR
ncbi:MAG: hypothetical protein U0359_34735 [Byssovorax sp.]